MNISRLSSAVCCLAKHAEDWLLIQR